MGTPEWDIFGRIEELEDITLELAGAFESAGKPDAESTPGEAAAALPRDTIILAQNAFILGFRALVALSSRPRKMKDRWVGFLKKQGLSKEVLNSLEEWMVAICDAIEKKPQ